MHRPHSIPVFEKGHNDNSTLLSLRAHLSELEILRRIQIFLLKIKLDRICVFRKKVPSQQKSSSVTCSWRHQKNFFFSRNQRYFCWVYLEWDNADRRVMQLDWNLVNVNCHGMSRNFNLCSVLVKQELSWWGITGMVPIQ